MLAPPGVRTIVGWPEGAKCAELPLEPWNSGRGPLPALFEPKLLPALLFGTGPLPALLFGTGPLPALLFVPKLRPALLFGTGPLPELPLGTVFLPALLFGAGPLPALLLVPKLLPALLFGTGPLPALLFGTGPLPLLPLAGPLLPVLVGAAVCPPAGWLAAGAVACAACAVLLPAGADAAGLFFNTCAYKVPDVANSTATSAVARQPEKSAFQIRRALIEFLL
jgi:hypothetical protein